MCGDYDSVIGGDKNSWIKKFEINNSFKRINHQIKILLFAEQLLKLIKIMVYQPL